LKLLISAVVAGIGYAFAFEPFSYWMFLPFAFAMFFCLLHNKSLTFRFLLGFFFGLAYWLIHINWLSILSPWVLLITAVALSLIYGFFASLTYVFQRNKYWLLAYGLTFLTLESLLNYWPFGGFNWGTIGYVSAKNPLAPLVSGIGVFGLSILIISSSFLIIVIFNLIKQRAFSASIAVLLIWLIPVGFLQVLAISQNSEASDESLRVGAVQGNVPRLGLEFNAQRKAVYENHVSETLKLIQTGENFDLIVWPENAPDVDPFENPEVILELNQLSLNSKSPILVGSRMNSSLGPVNASILVTGETTYENAFYYAKKKLVPFGERVPFEDYLAPIASNFGPISNSLVPGETIGILNLEENRVVGLLICFEVAWGQLAKELVDSGAQVLIVQTNNATYGLTTQLAQQFNIATLRAMESQRQVLTVATSGISGLVDKDGSIVWQAEEFEAESKSLEVNLYSKRTLGGQFNYYLQIIVLLSFMALLLFSIIKKRKI